MSMTPPDAVRRNYRRGLQMHEDGQTGDGIEPVTIRMARKLADGGAVSEEWARKANRWWGRNARFLDAERDTPAYASSMLWGGAAGRDWYASLVRRLDAANNFATDFANHKLSDMVAAYDGANGRDQMTDTPRRIRANIRAQVNAANIRTETRDGREVIVVPSATLPDDVVMNGILYPADEIEKSYHTLNQTPAPLGHPKANGLWVSAKSPVGLNVGYFGAWNENARREGGRVHLDKVIDVERANESAMGKRVLDAIKAGDPVHTSTGLTMTLHETSADGAEFEARNMVFDHDAILLDEPGAATPEQGVGLMVNAAIGADGAPMDAVNSALTESMDEQIDYLGTELLATLDRREVASRWAQVKAAIFELIGQAAPNDTEAKGLNMDDLEKVMARLDAIEERMNGMDETIANMGKGYEETAANAKAAVDAINAQAEAARADLVAQVVNAGVLSEDIAKETPDAALRAMVANAAPKPAPGVFGGFNASGDSALDFSPLAE
jgi:hypothetical protein